MLAAGAIAVELGGGTALLLGLFARPAAAVLIPFTIAATLMFHNFWAAPEAQVVMQTINFLKNLGLLGSLALVACYGPGVYAVQAAIRPGSKGAPGSRDPWLFRRADREPRQRGAVDLDAETGAIGHPHHAFLVLDRIFQDRLTDRMLGAVEFEHRLERCQRGRRV